MKEMDRASDAVLDLNGNLNGSLRKMFRRITLSSFKVLSKLLICTKQLRETLSGDLQHDRNATVEALLFKQGTEVVLSQHTTASLKSLQRNKRSFSEINKMASSKSSSHVRSISLPSAAHPLTSSVEEQLKRLRSSSASSTSQRLGGLKDLYDSVDDWLQLSLTQHALSSERIEDLLDGSSRLLDVCGSIGDVVSKTQGCIGELESSIRRTRGGNYSVLVNEIDAFLGLRKKMKKEIWRSLEILKKMEKQRIRNQQDTEEPTLRLLREVEEVGVSVFESVLCFLSGPKAKHSGWSVVSKVLSSKRVEVEKLDVELIALKSGKDDTVCVQNVLKRVESGIREIKEVRECVFRCLVKTRVSLLNILNH